MSEGIESITLAALGRALDAASQRQQVIAANIANANTVGYVPQRFGFGEQFEELQRSLRAGRSLDVHALSAFQGQLTPVVDTAGQPQQVRLDEEMAAMTQNTVQYQALIQGLNRHMSILGVAASDGKR